MEMKNLLADSFLVKCLGNAWSMIPVALGAMLAVTLLFGQNSNSAGERMNPSLISPAGRPNNATGHSHNEGRKATELMGIRVEDLHGEKLGVVNDLIINPRSGRLEFVVLAQGGFAGVGSRLKVVPPTALSQATAKVGTLALNINPIRWKSAPSFSKDQLASLENSAAAQLVYQYYQQPWPKVAVPADREGGRPGRLELAMDLIGQTVVNRQHQILGAISDFLVDLKHPQTSLMILKPDAAVLKVDQSAAQQLFAIPANAFNTGGHGGNLILNVNPRRFHQAQSLDGGSWMTTPPGMDSPLIYLFQSRNDRAPKMAFQPARRPS